MTRLWCGKQKNLKKTYPVLSSLSWGICDRPNTVRRYILILNYIFGILDEIPQMPILQFYEVAIIKVSRREKSCDIVLEDKVDTMRYRRYG